MGITLRLPADLDADLRAAADEDHLTKHQAVVRAIETYLAQRETVEIKADPDALSALAGAREAAEACDVLYGTDAVRALLEGHRTS